MTSCHNAANEFLRQYWSAVLPAQAGTLGTSNVVTKAAKAGKMAGYLRGMEGKINAVIHTAVVGGIDPARVRAVSLPSKGTSGSMTDVQGMAPTLGAVKIALQREDKRLKATKGT